MEPANPDHTHWLDTDRGGYVTLCQRQGSESVIVNEYTRVSCPECKATERRL